MVLIKEMGEVHRGLPLLLGDTQKVGKVKINLFGLNDTLILEIHFWWGVNLPNKYQFKYEWIHRSKS